MERKPSTRVPPQKPPRKCPLAGQVSPMHQAQDTQVVTIKSVPQSPLSTRFLITPPESPSVMEGGSRMSSFGPRTGAPKTSGHTRSRSETIPIQTLNLEEISNIHVKKKTLGIKESKSQSQDTIPCSNLSDINSVSPSPRSPSKISASPESPSRRGISTQLSPKSPSKLSRSPDSPPSAGISAQLSQSPRLRDKFKSRVSYLKDPGEVTAKQASNVTDVEKLRSSYHPNSNLTPHPIEGIKRVTHLDPDNSYQNRQIIDCSSNKKEQHDKIMKELSIGFSGTSGTGCRDQCIDKSSNRSPKMIRKILSPTPTVNKSNHCGTMFFPSDPSKMRLQVAKTPSSSSLLDVQSNKMKNVRHSSFVSQDEDETILENKSLLVNSSTFPEERNQPFLGVSSPFLGPNHLSPRTDIEEDELTQRNSTNGSLDLPFLNIKSEHYENLKKSLDSESWMVANDEEGKIYYYEESEGKSQWNLPQEENVVDERESIGSPTSPNESLRISLLVQKLPELSKNVVKEGFLHRTFFAREGKKARKNWTQSYAQFIKGNFDRGCSGLILFTKTKDDYKKPDMFEFYPNCSLEDTCDKKTSRQQVLGLRNGHGTEVLLQFEDKEIASEWFRVLQEHEGMQYITALAEEKKGKRGTDKMKRSASMECLNPDSKGITDKLRNFIKRRPLKETLEKKGIYKEAVFGSTLAELSSQDKTLIPIFVLQCIQHIEKTTENLRTDGLYRISGNAAQIQKIRFEVAQRKYCVLSQEKEVHNLSGSLKLFFRELKEPLIPYVNYKDFIEATGSEYRRMNQQEEKLAKAVRRLPTENYETLKFLLQHLLRVSEFEKENRMSLSNLAIVFGPCLLWPESSTSHDLMTDVMLHNRVIEGLLKDFTKVFASKR